MKFEVDEDTRSRVGVFLQGFEDDDHRVFAFLEPNQLLEVYVSATKSLKSD